MPILPIAEVIPETNLVMFSPHFDDFLLGLGGYVLELRDQQVLAAKQIHIIQVFSRSNYQNNSGAGNYDTSLERIKFATGRRLIEELDCLDELIGAHQYRYELLGELEALLRGNALADTGLAGGEIEFPHGMYPDFQDADWEIFARLKITVQKWAMQTDTALIFPLAIKEHLDHFLVREAGIAVAEALGDRAKAAFYFQEDKPYAGFQTPEEKERIEALIRSHQLQPRVYRHHPQEVVDLAFRHYLSQVDETYRQGVINRGEELARKYQSEFPCDQMFAFQNSIHSPAA